MKINKCLGLILLLAALSVINPVSSYAATQSWQSWIGDVRREAIGQGISPDLFDQAFQGLHEPSRRVKGLARSQPEHRLTYSKYLHSRVDSYRIAMGRKYYAQNKALLLQIGQKYGVDPCFIVSFWGMESSYGSYMGDFPVIRSLATLAYDSNRRDFFRNELFLALHILNDGHVSLENFHGEWAGASGQPQFLPSSWRDYAVDYDGDGRKDIWDSKADVFASIANYLVKNGWKRDEPWAIGVDAPQAAQAFLNQKEVKKTISEWSQLGVHPKNGQSWPENQSLQARLVEPDGGPQFLIFNNFDVIMKWNHSNYYVGTVGYLAEQICGKPLY